MGLEVTHQYDDIVFVEHSAFIFQFDDESDSVKLYFNRDCSHEDSLKIEKSVMELAVNNKITVERKGSFTMEQVEGEENIELKFYDS